MPPPATRLQATLCSWTDEKSRSAAQREFSMEDYMEAMKGCNVIKTVHTSYPGPFS